MLSDDIREFIDRHRAYGTLIGDATEPTERGYSVWIACSCGVTFERWVFPDDAAADLAFLARLN